LGLWLIAGKKRAWPLRIAGVICLLLPHVIGAPAAKGQSSVPTQLIRQFAVTSLATTALFWLLLGTIGGWIYSRSKISLAEGEPSR
jgi:predicted cobalt transporter CbtA